MLAEAVVDDMDLHKGIVQAHHGNDKDVHAEGKANDEHVEVGQFLILCQTKHDQVDPNEVDVVKVQAAINKEIYDLLASVPPVV